VPDREQRSVDHGPDEGDGSVAGCEHRRPGCRGEVDPAVPGTPALGGRVEGAQHRDGGGDRRAPGGGGGGGAAGTCPGAGASAGRGDGRRDREQRDADQGQQGEGGEQRREQTVPAAGRAPAPWRRVVVEGERGAGASGADDGIGPVPAGGPGGVPGSGSGGGCRLGGGWGSGGRCVGGLVGLGDRVGHGPTLRRRGIPWRRSGASPGDAAGCRGLWTVGGRAGCGVGASAERADRGHEPARCASGRAVPARRAPVRRPARRPGGLVASGRLLHATGTCRSTSRVITEVRPPRRSPAGRVRVRGSALAAVRSSPVLVRRQHGRDARGAVLLDGTDNRRAGRPRTARDLDARPRGARRKDVPWPS
jgi:hypothetical protein